MKADSLQRQFEELKILNSIAVQLNGTTQLDQAMQLTLQHTCELMNIQTAWIWLVHPRSNSVYLASSHQLPPILRQHPERLSGECYCITKYFDDNLEEATNISEITCTRLKDIEEGTDNLKFHATIPLFDKTQKIGLINLVTPTSVKFSDRQLDMLHTIGTLLSTAIIRARQFEKSKEEGALEERKRLSQSFYNKLLTNIENLQIQVSGLSSNDESVTNSNQLKDLQELSSNIHALTQQTLSDLKKAATAVPSNRPLLYPTTPLTKRELEVLNLLKKGKTNKAIASELFITERTIKFHVSTLLSKLDARNRTEVVRIAVERGLVKF